MAEESKSGAAAALLELHLNNDENFNMRDYTCTFNVYWGETVIPISAQKLVLFMWSHVFVDMEVDDHIDVHDVRPTVIKAIVNFMYGIRKEIENSTDEEFLRDVYEVAVEYQIKEIKRVCRNRLNNFVAVKIENVFKLLDAAILTKSKGLEQRCIKVLEEQTVEVLKSYDIQNITPFIVTEVVKLKKISLPSENDLLVWVYEWAECEFDKLLQENPQLQVQHNNLHLSIIHPFLEYLNFASLTAEQFGALVNKHVNFFNQNECFRIFMNITCPGTEVEMPYWSKKYSRSYKEVKLGSTVELVEGVDDSGKDIVFSEHLTASESVCNSDTAAEVQDVIENEKVELTQQSDIELTPQSDVELTQQSDVSDFFVTPSDMYNSFIVEEYDDSPWNSLKEPSLCRRKIKKKKIKKSYLLPEGKSKPETRSWKTNYSSGDFESLIGTVWKQQRYGSAGA